MGSAASAVQIAPSISDKVDSLYVFQRTPNWYFPKFDPVYPEELKKIFKIFPFLMTIQRLFFFFLVEGKDNKVEGYLLNKIKSHFDIE